MKSPSPPATLNKLLTRILWRRLFFPAAVLAGLLMGYSTYNIAANINLEQHQTTLAIANRIDDFLTNAYQVLDAAGAIAEFASIDDLQQDLAALQPTNPFFDTIYTLDSDGKINAIAPFDPAYLSIDMSNQDYYKNREIKPIHNISKPFISPKTGSLTVYLTNQLPNGAVIVGELSLDKLQKIVEDYTTSFTSQSVFISDAKGNLLAHPNFNLVAQQANINFIRSWSKKVDTKWSHFTFYDRKVFFENQLNVAQTDWIITAEYPLAQVYNTFLLSTGSAVLLFLLFWFIMIWNLGKESSRKIIAPISRLSEKANALARGSISDVSPTISRIPASFFEVEQLADNFDHMYRSIQDRQRVILESELKYRRMIELSNDAIYIEFQNKLVIINRKFSDIFGILPEEINREGISFSQLVTDSTRESLLESHERIQNQAEPSLQLELSAIDKNGQEVQLEASLTPYPFQGGVAVQSELRDITDRKRAELAERDQRILAEALRDTASALNTTNDFDLLLDRILVNVDRVVPHTSSSVMLIDKDGESIRIVAQKGYEKYNVEGWVKQVVFKLHETPNLLFMYETGKPIIIPDTRLASGWIRPSEIDWLISYTGAPIRVKDTIIGFLGLDSTIPNFFTQEHANRLLTFCDQAGIAINNVRLLLDLKNSHQELATAYDTTLLGWSKALELRDYETQGHSMRVTETTLKLAQYLGIPDPELTNIRYGALLHDIGKIGIPDAILFKRGPLTEAEWRTMRLHPIYAQQVLAHIPYLSAAVDIPYYHHEHWDGSGYPHGLVGEKIPLAARIFTIVDVWDSLCSQRPYHTSWPRSKVIEYMQEQAGKLFDPKIVKIFIDMILSETNEVENP